MGDNIIKKSVPSTILAIILAMSNIQVANVFAEDNSENNIEDNIITEINLMNTANVDYLSEYIKSINNNEEYISEEDILNNNKIIDNNVFISNIKNTYNIIDSDNFIENELPMLAANVVSNENNNLIYEPYTIKDFEGTTIGIIGVVSKDNIVDLENNYEIIDELEAINKYTQELLELGIENIVVATDMVLSTDTYEIFEEIDSQVDIIISENEINLENKYEDIITQDSEILFVQIDDNTIVDIELSINKEDNTIENRLINFINSEEIILEEEDNLDSNQEVAQGIQPYIVGGTDNSSDDDSNQDDNNNNENKDDDDENKDDDDEGDDDEDDDDEDDDDEDEGNKESDDKAKKTTTTNPKTGDTSISMYVLGCVGAIIGLSMNKNKKNKK